MRSPAPRIEYQVAHDGYRIAVRRWHVEQPIAHIVCLHGIVSHSGWYQSSGAYLAREGFDVHMPDRRGSGLNRTARGDIHGWKTWLLDVENYLESLSSGTPKILLGISWGGTLATAVARHRGDLLDGLILSCPGLFSRKAPNALQRIFLKLASKTRLQQIRVAIPLRDPALFTGNDSKKAYIASDPLTLWHITLRCAAANLHLTRFALGAGEAMTVPTLVMLAGQDPITVNAQVREFMKRFHRADQRVIEYPSASHTLEFEPDPLPYFHDLASWCRVISNPR